MPFLGISITSYISHPAGTLHLHTVYGPSIYTGKKEANRRLLMKNMPSWIFKLECQVTFGHFVIFYYAGIKRTFKCCTISPGDRSFQNKKKVLTRLNRKIPTFGNFYQNKKVSSIIFQMSEDEQVFQFLSFIRRDMHRKNLRPRYKNWSCFHRKGLFSCALLGSNYLNERKRKFYEFDIKKVKQMKPFALVFIIPDNIFAFKDVKNSKI